MYSRITTRAGLVSRKYWAWDDSDYVVEWGFKKSLNSVQKRRNMLAFVRYHYNKSSSEEYDLHKIWKNIKFANELAGNE